MPARGTGGEPVNPVRSAAAASARFSSNMDPQMGLFRALLLLLFLHLMPLGGRSHPLGGPSPGLHLELSRVQVSRAAYRHQGWILGSQNQQVSVYRHRGHLGNQKVARLGARTLYPSGRFTWAPSRVVGLR